MAGLDRNKKRSGSSNPRVSRFSEVLGAAHESTHKPGYPDSQPSEPLPAEESTPKAGYPESQPSEHRAGAKEERTKKAGYPKNQTSKQSSRLKDESRPQTGYPDSQPPAQPGSEPSPSPPAKSQELAWYPTIQPSEKSSTQPSASPSEEKLAKRENPDYTQTTFRIPKKLSRQINRALMDLADSGVEIDRSDLLEELAGAFVRLADSVGAVEALKQLKNLGTQMNE